MERTQLENATAEWTAAKERRARAVTRSQKDQSDSDIEFWSNKMAFYSEAA